MRRTALLLLCAVAGLRAGQANRFRFTDGSMTVEAAGGRADQNVNGGYNLKLKGTVAIVSPGQGLSLNAEAVQAETQASGGKSELRHATATGSVHMVKTVRNAAGSQSTDIVGSRAEMQAAKAGSVVQLAGPVTIRSIDRVKRKTMVATGSSGVATLAPGDGKNLSNGLLRATLNGPVRATIVQAAKPGGKGDATLVATGNRMEIDNTGKEPIVTLIGNVDVHGEGSSTMRFTGAERAVIRLNAAGEVVGFSTERG